MRANHLQQTLQALQLVTIYLQITLLYKEVILWYTTIYQKEKYNVMETQRLGQE